MANVKSNDANEFNQASKLWVFAKSGQMSGHGFTDDVAITYASSKSEAIANFSKLYNNVAESDVSEVTFNSSGVAILTDY